MIGGENEVVKRLDPIFKTLAPGRALSTAHRAAKSHGTAEEDTYTAVQTALAIL